MATSRPPSIDTVTARIADHVERHGPPGAKGWVTIMKAQARLRPTLRGRAKFRSVTFDIDPDGHLVADVAVAAL